MLLDAKVLIFSGTEINSYEKYPVSGFQSSAEIPLHIGIGDQKIDSAFLVWPDNRFQKLQFTKLDTTLVYHYQQGLAAL